MPVASDSTVVAVFLYEQCAAVVWRKKICLVIVFVTSKIYNLQCCVYMLWESYQAKDQYIQTKKNYYENPWEKYIDLDFSYYFHTRPRKPQQQKKAAVFCEHSTLPPTIIHELEGVTYFDVVICFSKVIDFGFLSGHLIKM